MTTRDLSVYEMRVVGRIVEMRATSCDWGPLSSAETFQWLKGHSGHGIRVTDERAELVTKLKANASGGPFIELSVVLRGHEIAVISTAELLVGHLIIDNRWISISQVAINNLLEDIPKLQLVSPHPSEASIIQLLARHCAREAVSDSLSYGLVDEWSASATWHTEATPIPQLQGAFEARNYQKSGFRWLSWIRRLEIGGLLGDPMGLGKTLQILLLLKAETDRKLGPNLVVCPTSLVVNWLREAEKFVGIIGHSYTPGNRLAAEEALRSGGFVVTTYDMVRRDELFLSQFKFNLVIADEAQYLKNSESQRSSSIRSLKARCRIAVTGTPLENSIQDVWSVMDFVMPGVLGTKSDFLAIYGANELGPHHLADTVRPIVLRRDPESVEDQLPKSVSIDVPLTMPPMVEDEYLIAESDPQPVLALIGRLRQVTSYVTSDTRLPTFLRTDDGGKFDYLATVIPEIAQRHEKFIVFAPFTKTISTLANFFAIDIGIRFVRVIDGTVPPSERQDLIDKFSSFDGSAALVLNPRAAGVGLNIQAANHVFHFSPEWNPAVIDQATARSLRKGQSKTVFVHHLFFIDSVEEVMNDRLASKRDLAAAATPLMKDYADEHEIRQILSQLARRRARRDS